MKRLVKYLGVTAVVASVGCLYALAGDTPHIGPISKPGVHSSADIWRGVDNAVTPMPRIEAMPASQGARQSGPVATTPQKGSSASSTLQSASSIPGTNLGSFLTPQERTSLSVKKTIRRLG